MFDYIMVEPHHKRSTNVIYLIFCIIGGFHFTRLANQRSRYIWWIMNAITLGYCSVIGPIWFVLTMPFDLVEWLTVGGLASAHFYVTVMIPTVTFYYREDLMAVLKEVDDEFDSHEPTEKLEKADPIERKKFDTVAISFRWFAVLQGTAWAVASSGPVYLIVFGDKSFMANSIFYVQATPFAESVTSYSAFVAVFLFQTPLILLGTLIGTCVSAFGLAIANEMHNAFVHLSMQLEVAIYKAILNLGHADGSWTLQLGNEQKLAEFDDSEVFETFKAELGAIVSRVQRLTGLITLLIPWLELMFAVNLLSFVSTQTIFLYIIIAVECEVVLKIKMAISMVTLASALYASCLIGSTFEDTSTLFSNELYFSPWYDLPSKYRKMLNIFLCQSQRPVEFFAFKMYPMIMMTFARTSNMVYAIINFVHSS